MKQLAIRCEKEKINPRTFSIGNIANFPMNDKTWSRSYTGITLFVLYILVSVPHFKQPDKKFSWFKILDFAGGCYMSTLYNSGCRNCGTGFSLIFVKYRDCCTCCMFYNFSLSSCVSSVGVTSKISEFVWEQFVFLHCR